MDINQYVKNKIKFFIFQKSWRWILSIFCILIFVLMENPSILEKLQHINTQFFSFQKSFVLLGSELVLFLCILFSTRSFRWYKFSICVVLSLSTLIFDTYFYTSNKVIEFQEFLLLYQSKANLLDAVEMYWMQILQACPRVLVLWIGVYLLPPPPHSQYVNKVKAISCFASSTLFSY